MEQHKTVSKAAGTVGSMTLLSRVFGFIRDMVIASMLGSSAAADAFFVAFRIPNVQRRLLAEGAVSAAFIPVFSEYKTNKGEKEAWTLASNLLNILFLVLTVVTIGLAVFATAVITFFAPGFIEEPEKFDLTIKLTRFMAPYLMFIGISAFCMGVLNAYKKFALSAAAPVLLNISMITGGLAIAPNMDQPVYGLAIGVLIGGALQFAVQLPATFRLGLKFTWTMNWKHPGVRKIGRLMVPAILGLAVYEINLMVDTLLASLLPGGSISYLYYANRVVQLPLGVFGVALSIAILPMLSDQAARKQISELRSTISFGIRLILFITIPATVGLILLRTSIINTLFERGEFLPSATEGTAVALLYYSIGLCAFAGTKVIVSAFYSLQDTKTPMRVGMFAMGLNIVLNLILMGPLQHGGLALATSIAAMVNVFTLLYFLKKRLGRIEGRAIVKSTAKLCIASFVMCIVVYFCNNYLFNSADSSFLKSIELLMSITIGVLTFGLISRLMKNEELTFLLSMRKGKKIPKAE